MIDVPESIAPRSLGAISIEVVATRKWFWTPDEGAAVPEDELLANPVDPVIYKMNDIWGYDPDELPCEPFDIEIKSPYRKCA